MAIRRGTRYVLCDSALKVRSVLTEIVAMLQTREKTPDVLFECHDPVVLLTT